VAGYAMQLGGTTSARLVLADGARVFF